MKFNLLHTFFCFLFILGLTLSNNYLVSTFCFDDDFIELSENVEKEIEEESEEKKEELEKEQISISSTLTYINWFSNSNYKFKHHLKSSVHYFDIPTPPPELS